MRKKVSFELLINFPITCVFIFHYFPMNSRLCSLDNVSLCGSDSFVHVIHEQSRVICECLCTFSLNTSTCTFLCYFSTLNFYNWFSFFFCSYHYDLLYYFTHIHTTCVCLCVCVLVSDFSSQKTFFLC